LHPEVVVDTLQAALAVAAVAVAFMYVDVLTIGLHMDGALIYVGNVVVQKHVYVHRQHYI
jgi:hypothetical protein